jgi:hypothetical protein
MCTRIVGPVHADEAKAILSALMESLRKAGLTVEVEIAADD